MEKIVKPRVTLTQFALGFFAALVQMGHKKVWVKEGGENCFYDRFGNVFQPMLPDFRQVCELDFIICGQGRVGTCFGDSQAIADIICKPYHYASAGYWDINCNVMELRFGEGFAQHCLDALPIKVLALIRILAHMVVGSVEEENCLKKAA